MICDNFSVTLRHVDQLGTGDQILEAFYTNTHSPLHSVKKEDKTHLILILVKKITYLFLQCCLFVEASVVIAYYGNETLL